MNDYNKHSCGDEGCRDELCGINVVVLEEELEILEYDPAVFFDNDQDQMRSGTESPPTTDEIGRPALDDQQAKGNWLIRNLSVGPTGTLERKECPT